MLRSDRPLAATGVDNCEARHFSAIDEVLAGGKTFILRGFSLGGMLGLSQLDWVIAFGVALSIDVQS